MIQPGLNLFEMLPRKVHGALLMVGGLANIMFAGWTFALKDAGGIFGLLNVNNIQAAAPWIPDWLIQIHKSPVTMWFHIVLFTVIGLGVVWEGIKMWRTGR